MPFVPLVTFVIPPPPPPVRGIPARVFDAAAAAAAAALACEVCGRKLYLYDLNCSLLFLLDGKGRVPV
ncbi:hypothetical protein AGABI1DRAFT_116165 [Agaricus bisporus var. burnettii JB137-S8]|uniref:Uncharacterized protein n=1 Tax=Agaricus bisporus var. burnettii (strain JB137-S8 / ATCC MYA-4627 / FGSC 10392) TaxID=597362 RepID=K5XMM2_AGABU|nr:uncharacterized protein AGABI1DRAFT_116165 [Agaricus bisporus var. burnettii JB137-S8]EKM75845.1 hypothetical protein AGABI1DRAFT_116165 [Agaricus bisporus var. burnettii JB137-S8]